MKTKKPTSSSSRFALLLAGISVLSMTVTLFYSEHLPCNARSLDLAVTSQQLLDPVNTNSVNSLRSTFHTHHGAAAVTSSVALKDIQEQGKETSTSFLREGSSRKTTTTLTTSLKRYSSSSVTANTCHYYMAESTIPGAGLGMFTAKGLLKDEMVGFPDVCLYVGDAPDHWTHLRSHSFGPETFYAQYEGNNSRALCEGFTIHFNTVPDRLVNSENVSPVLPTNAGLHRARDPGAGSVTHHYGVHARALDTITAGSELTLK